MTTADAELPPASTLALPIVITIPSSPPPQAEREPVEPAGTLVQVLLQIGHRIGTVALLALLGAAYAAYAGKPFYIPLAIAAGCADVGICTALIANSRSIRWCLIAVTAAAGFIGAAWLLAESHGGVAIVVGLADVSLCLAIHRLLVSRPSPEERRESTGLAVFNGTLFIVAIVFMLIARTGVIGDGIRDAGVSVRTQMQDFFTAPPAVPVQP